MSPATREYAEAYKILGRQQLIVKAAEHYAAYLEKQKNTAQPVKFPAVVEEFLEQSRSKDGPPETPKIAKAVLVKAPNHSADTSKESQHGY